jgi:hypothetical protein
MCQMRNIDNIIWRNFVPVLLSAGSLFRENSYSSQDLIYVLSRLFVIRLNYGTLIKISYVIDQQNVL